MILVPFLNLAGKCPFDQLRCLITCSRGALIDLGVCNWDKGGGSRASWDGGGGIAGENGGLRGKKVGLTEGIGLTLVLF